VTRSQRPAVRVLLTAGSRSLSYLLGGVILVIAAAVAASGWGVRAVAGWALDVFGATFLALFAVLVAVAVFAWIRLTDGLDSAARRLWREVGLHAANGVSTVALTYTLLGISLGIGTLAGRPLDPSTVQDIVGELTRHFGRAFMTTVVGLPAAAALRALLLIADTARDGREEDNR
jgi:hypothetical protein